MVPTEQLTVNHSEGTHFRLVVTQVEHCHQFWFSIFSEDHFTKASSIMDTMESFYASSSGSLYHISSKKHLTPGCVIAARYREEGFHRAVILKISPHRMLKLCYIDFGTVDVQKLSQCRYLKKEWTHLPGQAIEASLFGVIQKPGVTRMAREALLKLTSAQPGSIVAVIRSGVTKPEMVQVEGEVETLVKYQSLALTLIDACAGGKHGLNINEEMVRLGFCDPAPDEWKIMNQDDNVQKLDDVAAAKFAKVDELTHPENEILNPSLYLKLLRLHEMNLKMMIDQLVSEDSDQDIIKQFEEMRVEAAEMSDKQETQEVSVHIDSEIRPAMKLLKKMKKMTKMEKMKKKSN